MTKLINLIFLVLLATVHTRSEAIKMTEIQALTLHKGEMTMARRTHPIPQLDCVGGSAKNSNFHPDVVQCVNVGHDGYDVQWECKADLDDSVKFGKITVSCEGYSSPSDPYVLKGSCGLKYNLEYTRKGQQAHSGYQSNDEYYGTSHYSRTNSESSGVGSFIMFIFIVAVVWMTLSACTARRRVNPNEFPQAGFGGPQPGGYGPQPGGYGQQGYGYGPYDQPPGTNQNNGYGGFWSGLATGGILSWLMRPRGYGYGYNNYGYNNYGYDQGYHQGYSAGRPSGGFRSGGSSSHGGSRTTSGFGGTERR